MCSQAFLMAAAGPVVYVGPALSPTHSAGGQLWVTASLTGEKWACTGISICISMLNETKHTSVSVRVTCTSCPGGWLPVRVLVHFLFQLTSPIGLQGFIDGENLRLQPSV